MCSRVFVRLGFLFALDIVIVTVAHIHPVTEHSKTGFAFFRVKCYKCEEWWTSYLKVWNAEEEKKPNETNTMDVMPGTRILNAESAYVMYDKRLKEQEEWQRKKTGAN